MRTTDQAVGVIVGRFQVACPHRGHRHLIDTVRAEHADVLVVLGVSSAMPTRRNPLSYEMRRVMLAGAYPSIAIASLADHPSDRAWSHALDALIARIYPRRVAILYGSRDSFLPRYSGRFPTAVVPEIPEVNATADRDKDTSTIEDSEAFRRGVMHAVYARLPNAYPTVDIAIMRGEHVLLGRKPTDSLGTLRFIGGFVDPTDASLEAAARREAYEETRGMEVADVHYVGSAKSGDWRYRGTEDGIMTSLFRATYVFGALMPGDDIDHLEWVRASDMLGVLVPEHLALGEMLIASLN